MELAKLQYFVCVASSDSMQKAAEVLHVSQSTLSMAVKNLEQELNVELFRRSGRRLELTEAGKKLQIEAANVLNQVENIRQQMKLYQGGGQNGVSIATEAPDFSAEADVLLRKLRPSYKTMQNLPKRSMIKSMLQAGQVDFAVTLFDDSDSVTESELVLREPLMLLVNQEHPLHGETSINFSQIERETLVSLPEGYAFRYLCELFFSMVGVHLNEIHEVRDPEMTPRAVRSGYGVGFIPRSTYLLSMGELNDVRALPLNDNFCARQIFLTRRKGRPLSSEAQEVCEFFHRFGRWTGLHQSFPTIDCADQLLAQTEL